MPLKCFRKPNRLQRRNWTAKAVGRVACYARQAGETVEELLEELQKCAPCTDQRRRRRRAQLEAVMLENSEAMGQATTAITAMVGALVGLLLLSRFVPALKATSIPVTLARATLITVTRRLVSAKAANDDMYREILRQAA